MADNTNGPDLAGTPYGGYNPLPQIDYRNDPNHGQSGFDGAAPSYDRPLDGPAVAPQPDSAIRSYDVDDKLYNIMDPREAPTGPGSSGGPHGYYPRAAGWSPDLASSLAWERSAAGQTAHDGSEGPAAPRSSMP